MAKRESRPKKKTLVLYPAKIALATVNVISDPKPPAGVPVQGVPLGIFKEALRRGKRAQAIEVLVDPPPNVDQYTEITLWLNGVQSGIAQKVVNTVMTFAVFQSELRDGVINVIKYQLKNHAGNTSDSVELWALYSATLPGGNDVPGTGDHPALKISLPPELGDPPFIGNEQASAGVLLTLDYPYRKPYDVITWEIDRERYTYTVKPNEVSQPFSVLIDRAKLDLVDGLGDCPISFTVVDQLLNTTYKRRWSKRIYAHINLKIATPREPLLREVRGDDMDDPGIVDRDKLNGRPLLVVIIPQQPTFEVGDTVIAFYQVNDADEIATEVGVITSEFGALLPCILEIPNAHLASGSRLRVRFELYRPSGTVIGKSRTAIAEVIGKAAPYLPPPSIKQASGASLDPFAAKDALTAVVHPYDNMIGTQLLVQWTGTPDGGSHTTVPVNVTTQGSQEIALPNSVVAFNLGESVTVTYVMLVDGGSTESLPLRLMVQPIADGDPNLPMPSIDGAVGNELDVSQLKEDAQLRIAEWPLQAAGQIARLRYDGFDENGEPVEKVLLEDVTLEQTSGLAIAAVVEWLRGLRGGSELRISFELNFGLERGSNAFVLFPLKKYTVDTLIELVPEIISVRDFDGIEIPNEETTIHRNVTLSGTATRSQKVQLLNNGTAMGVAVNVDSNGKWEHQLTELDPLSYYFTAKGIYGTHPISSPPRAFKILIPVTEENFDSFPPQKNLIFLDTPATIITATPPISFGIISWFEQYPGPIKGNALTLGGYGNYEVKMKFACSKISFTYFGIDHQGTVVKFFDINDHYLGNHPLFVNGESYSTLTFSAENIKKMQISSSENGIFYVDNLTFTYK